MFFGIGSKYSSLLDVSSSYEEARKSLEYGAYEVRRVVWYKDIPQVHCSYYYPQDIEQKLIYMTKMGQIDEVKNILNIVFERNMSTLLLPESELKQLKYSIRGTIIRIKEALILDEDSISTASSLLCQLDDCDNWDHFSKQVICSYEFYCDWVNDQKKSHNLSLLNKIIEYIDNNFTKDSICLFSVASKFDMAENYLSHFFKDQTGETFSAYIERKRMALAVELLTKNDLPVSGIIKNIGYSNINTFYKAFKRVHGVSPRAYKK